MARAIHLLPWNLLVYARIHVVSTVLLAEMPLDRDSSWTTSFAPNVDLQDSSDRTSLLLGANPTSHPVDGSFLHDTSLRCARACILLAVATKSRTSDTVLPGRHQSRALRDRLDRPPDPTCRFSRFLDRPLVDDHVTPNLARPGPRDLGLGSTPRAHQPCVAVGGEQEGVAELTTCEAADEQVEEAAGTQAWKKRRTW